MANLPKRLVSRLNGELIGPDITWQLTGILDPTEKLFSFTFPAEKLLNGTNMLKVADAVKGQVVILAGGGVRTGGDILKMLALGADAVMIGRPFSVAAVGGLKEGVSQFIQRIAAELTAAKILTGTARADSVDRAILRG